MAPGRDTAVDQMKAYNTYQASGCQHLSGLRLSTAKTLPSRNRARVRTARRSDPRGAADFISTGASDTVVCTKHLLRLELATTRPRHQRGERQRLRGLETHLCPPAGRLKATGSGRTPVPVSTQLGRGAAHSSSSQRRAIGVSSEHGSPINAQDSGTFAPRCSPAVGAARGSGASARARSHAGSS
jgi:hypothetical protein